MAEFQVRSDAVDVEQIMRQIRARIREKRGADYTEQEIRELASVKLEKFLDPRGIRSNLVEEFRRNRVVSPAPPPIVVETLTIQGTHRSTLSSVRKMLAPVMKLFINPVVIVHDVNAAVQKIATTQTAINEETHRKFRQREEMDPLYYEVIHNLVVELTRLSIENSNLKMRVESLSSRMDFDERRSRALETVVQYKPAPRPGQSDRPQPDRSQSDRSQNERSNNERSNNDKPQGERAQNERPSRNQDRAQKDRSQGDASQPERAQSDRSQNNKSQGEPATTASADGQTAAATDPQRAGLEPRDGGERGERRRRRRRRRRPGQNLANGAAGSEQNSQGQQGLETNAQVGDADGYDGDDDGADSDGAENGATDSAPSASTSSTSDSHTQDRDHGSSEGPKE